MGSLSLSQVAHFCVNLSRKARGNAPINPRKRIPDIFCKDCPKPRKTGKMQENVNRRKRNGRFFCEDEMHLVIDRDIIFDQKADRLYTAS